MKHNRKKSGFTLVELMVFFVFISLVLAASAPIITKRVKYIPERVGHGKFMCYNGGHTQVYYNATKLISTQSVDRCTFKPPKKNALFKVELIGAGAGGTDSSPYADTTQETRSGGYSIPGGPWGDRSVNPTGSQLVDLFGNTEFVYVTTSGAGGAGESVSRTYTGIGSPHVIVNHDNCYPAREWDENAPYTVEVCDKDENGACAKTCEDVVDETTGETSEECHYTYHEETRYGDWVDTSWKQPQCSDWDQAASELSQSISDAADCGSSSTEWCYTIASAGLVSGYQASAAGIPAELPDFSTYTSATGEGQRGGSAIPIRLDGKIDFCDYKANPGGCGGNCGQITAARDPRCIPFDGADAYLQGLFGGNIAKTTTKEPGSECIGEGYRDLNYHRGDHPDAREPVYNNNLPNSDSHKEGAMGYDVLYYGAIKAWDKCATNTKRATGGNGGYYYYAEGSSISGNYRSALPEPDDADGLAAPSFPGYAFSNDSGSDNIPRMTISTTLDVRNHYDVGYGGGAGSYRTYYISNLDDDCIFDIPSGGPTVTAYTGTASIAALEAGLETSMTCNEGTLRLHASGGHYNPSTFGQSFNGFNYVNLSSGIVQSPSSFYTGGGGSSSPYQPNDIYTKYAISAGGFGAGGDGSSITDKCTRITGHYTQTVTHAGGTKSDYHDVESTNNQPCDEENDVSTSGASSGTGGAVIISW